MKINEIGKINENLFIMSYRKYSIYKIAEGLYIYEKVTAAATTRGFMASGDTSGLDCVLGCIEEIDTIEDGGVAK